MGAKGLQGRYPYSVSNSQTLKFSQDELHRTSGTAASCQELQQLAIQINLYA